jgi:hypothetical protein
VLVDSAQHQGPGFDGHVQLELPGIPPLHPANAVHALARRRAGGIESDSNCPFKRIRFVELNAARQLPLQREGLPSPQEPNLDVLVHVGILLKRPDAGKAEAPRSSWKLCYSLTTRRAPPLRIPDACTKGVTSMAKDATLAMQKQIIANQKKILANQQRIQRNQAKLDKIVANQAKLDRIIANQKAILAKLR